MESILVSSTVFLVVFGGALAGMRLRRVVPQNQLGPDVKDVIRLVTGLLVTMTALVLGMLVSTANSSYQQRKDQLTEMASDFVGVDRLLGSYGPETQTARRRVAFAGRGKPPAHLAKPGIPGPAVKTCGHRPNILLPVTVAPAKKRSPGCGEGCGYFRSHCLTAYLLVNVPWVGGELPLTSAARGCGRMADSHLR